MSDAIDPLRESANSAEFQELSQRCHSLQVALSARRSSLVAAKKALSKAGKTYTKAVSDAESRLADCSKSQQVLGKLRSSVVLYEDRIALDGAVYPMSPEVVATVDTAGNLSRTRRHTVTRFALLGPLSIFTPKAEKHDDRRLFLLLEGPDWAKLIEMKADQQKKARMLAQAINLAARTSESAAANRQARIATAREELQQARQNLGEIELAERVLRESYSCTSILGSAQTLKAFFDSSRIKESRVGVQAASLLQQAESASNEPIVVPPRPSIAESSAES